MKTILYVSSTIPEQLYKEYLSQNDKTDQQAQKFNRNVIKGFVENGFSVHVVSYRKNFVNEILPYTEENVTWHLLNCENNRKAFILCYKKIKELLNIYSDSWIFCDVLNISVTAGALLAAKRKRCCGIVTDVPGIYNTGFNAFVNKLVIKMYSSYVFLTQAMNDVLNPCKKPYCVMEGLYEQEKEVHKISQNISNKFVILYAGSLHKQYGIETLVKAFTSMDNENMELHIYGAGDFVDEIQNYKTRSIVYHGIKDNAEVVEAERNADLLINPRSKKELFTQYSFPSKTIEYMATGTPVLMQKLPGMPEEYCEHVFLYDDDSIECLQTAIKKIQGMPKQFLQKKGDAARTFIYENKNARMQVLKIINAFKLD